MRLLDRCYSLRPVYFSCGTLLRSATSFLCFVVGVLAASVSQAQSTSPSSSLIYRNNAPTYCVNEAAFRDHVAAGLGYDPFSPSKSDPNVEEDTVVAHLEGEPAQFRGMIKLLSPQGKTLGVRELSSTDASCLNLVDAMATAISVMLDPFGEVRKEHQEKAAQGLSEKKVAPNKIKPAPRVSERPIAQRPAARSEDVNARGARFASSFGTGISLWLSPAPALPLYVDLGVRLEWLSVAVMGKANFALGDYSDERGRSVLAHALSVGPRICALFLSAEICLSPQFGAYFGRATSTVNPHTVATFISTVDVDAAWRFFVNERMYVKVGAEMRTPVLRTELAIDAEIVWETPPLALSILMGVGAEI